MGDTFALRVERQVGWSDLNLGLLALLGGLTLMSSMILVAYLRAHQQGRILQIENQKWLWQLANHDGLTGLPNRTCTSLNGRLAAGARRCRDSAIARHRNGTLSTSSPRTSSEPGGIGSMNTRG